MALPSVRSNLPHHTGVPRKDYEHDFLGGRTKVRGGRRPREQPIEAEPLMVTKTGGFAGGRCAPTRSEYYAAKD